MQVTYEPIAKTLNKIEIIRRYAFQGAGLAAVTVIYFFGYGHLYENKPVEKWQSDVSAAPRNALII
jgi:hypothetical protein